MCGRYYIDDETSREIQKALKEISDNYSDIKIKTGEIRPTNDVPILVAKDNKINPDVLKWGFPNFANKGVIINARSETAIEKKTFRESLVSRRCIILASGFFEWNASKEKIYFTPPNENTMYMAGLYNSFNGESRFVILTTEANSSISDVHNRMPLLLSDNQIESWVLDNTKTQDILNQVPYQLSRSSEYEQQRLDLF